MYLPAPVYALGDRPAGAVPGVWLFTHTHVWGYVGTITHRNDAVDPVYRCAVCTDRVYDFAQSLGAGDEPWWNQKLGKDQLGFIQLAE